MGIRPRDKGGSATSGNIGATGLTFVAAERVWCAHWSENEESFRRMLHGTGEINRRYSTASPTGARIMELSSSVGIRHFLVQKANCLRSADPGFSFMAISLGMNQ